VQETLLLKKTHREREITFAQHLYIYYTGM